MDRLKCSESIYETDESSSTLCFTGGSLTAAKTGVKLKTLKQAYRP